MESAVFSVEGSFVDLSGFHWPGTERGDVGSHLARLTATDGVLYVVCISRFHSPGVFYYTGNSPLWAAVYSCHFLRLFCSCCSFCFLLCCLSMARKHGSKLKTLMSLAWPCLSNRVAVDPVAKFNGHMLFANCFLQFSVHKKIPLQVIKKRRRIKAAKLTKLSDTSKGWLNRRVHY